MSPPFFLNSYRYYINKQIEVYTTLGGDYKKIRGGQASPIYMDIILRMHPCLHSDGSCDFLQELMRCI